MIKLNNRQSGFTVIELLVTMFVGVAFIATGYQLYVAIIKDGGEIRARANASNTANDYMGQRAAADTTTCSTTNVTIAETLPVNSNITIESINSVVSAPQGCSSAYNVIRIETTVKYLQSGVAKEVSSAVYVAK